MRRVFRWTSIGALVVLTLVVNASVVWRLLRPSDQGPEGKAERERQAQLARTYAARVSGAWELRIDDQAPRLLLLAPAPRPFGHADNVESLSLVASAHACTNTSFVAVASACVDSYTVPMVAFVTGGHLLLPTVASVTWWSQGSTSGSPYLELDPSILGFWTLIPIEQRDGPVRHTDADAVAAGKVVFHTVTLTPLDVR